MALREPVVAVAVVIVVAVAVVVVIVNPSPERGIHVSKCRIGYDGHHRIVGKNKAMFASAERLWKTRGTFMPSPLVEGMLFCALVRGIRGPLARISGKLVRGRHRGLAQSFSLQLPSLAEV
eukprot:354646-Chlamydomonas_euryale.AAC.3